MGVTTLVRLAGALQLLQLPLMSLAAKKLGWQDELARVTLVNRRLFQAIGRGIVVYVMGTGVIVLCHAEAMTRTPLGRSLCVLQAVAWATRLGAQALGIARHMPKAARPFSRLATGVYASLTLAYSLACAWLWLGPPTPG